MNVIEVDDLKKSCGDRQGPRGVDLRADAGSVLRLLGPNGAGKSATVEIRRPARDHDHAITTLTSAYPAFI